MSVTSRLAALRERLAPHNLDALIVSDPVNRRYLSGFTGSAGWLLISADKALFAVDSRYYEQVGRQAPDFSLERVGYDFVGALPRLFDDLGARRVGFEAANVTVAQYNEWTQAAPEAEWAPTTGLVEAMRAVKEPGELETIRAAVDLTDQAFAQVCATIRPGMTEAQVTWDIEKFFRERGAVNWAAGPIVASGPNGALPHHRGGDRVIQRGEPIVIDMGCLVDGYHSDMTRTIILGEADDKFNEVYSVVLRAHLAARDGARPGVKGKTVDALARDIITSAGYGEAFGHSLGHGVGLAIHEEPRARQVEENALGANMTLTVEPGIYLPGWGGVRIEDLVVIGPDGAETLTQSPKSVEAMVIRV